MTRIQRGATKDEAGIVEVAVTAAGLLPGTHTGTITFTDGVGTSKTVKVTLTVTHPPQLTVSPTELIASLEKGAHWTKIGTVLVLNTGGGTLNWSATVDKTWIWIERLNGDPDNVSVRVKVTTAGLTAGIHRGTITFRDWNTDTTKTASVELTVTLPPQLAVSPTKLQQEINWATGWVNAGKISVKNAGGGTLHWSAETASERLYIRLSSSSGATTTEVDTVDVMAKVRKWEQGLHIYTGTITFTTGADTTKEVDVILTVPALCVTPSSLDFSSVITGGFRNLDFTVSWYD